MWLYYALFESSSWQATPGKSLLGLYVTDLQGRPITFARATIRHFAKIISSLTFLVGYILAGFTEKKQALHDMIASCLVTSGGHSSSTPTLRKTRRTGHPRNPKVGGFPCYSHESRGQSGSHT